VHIQEQTLWCIGLSNASVGLFNKNCYIFVQGRNYRKVLKVKTLLLSDKKKDQDVRLYEPRKRIIAEAWHSAFLCGKS